MEGLLMSKTNFFLVVGFLLFFFSQSEQRSIANCKKEFLDKRVNAAKFGYCWRYQPDFWDGNKAEKRCNMIGGHLVILDSRPKAKVLLQFLKDSAKAVTDGQYGSWFQRLYKRMYRGSVPWAFSSGVRGLKNKEIWRGTGKEVSWAAYTDRAWNKHRPGQTRCTAMHPAVSLWKFVHCHYRWPSVCEQKSGTSGGRQKAQPKPKPKPKPTTPPTTTTTTTTTVATTTTAAEEEEEPEYEYYEDEDEYYDDE